MHAIGELTAVVTGANRSDGIGLAIVRDLEARGAARVVGTYRSQSTAEALLALAQRTERVLAAPLDVTSDASVARFATWCQERLGAIDLLVNNAGLGDSAGDILAGRLEDLQLQLETHAIGMLRLSRALLPLMHHGAAIVSVSSTLGSIAGMSGHSEFYSAAKALQNALSRQLAEALRSNGIIVMSLSPGWVATSMGGRGAPLTPAMSAAHLVQLALSATPSDAATFRDYDGRTIAW